MVVFSGHARERMRSRKISEDEVVKAWAFGDVWPGAFANNLLVWHDDLAVVMDQNIVITAWRLK